MGIRCFGIAQRGRDVVPDLDLGPQPRTEFPMGDRLYVSGLPYAVTEEQLQDLFA